MSICPITYENLKPHEKIYSQEGLKKISPTLKNLNIFPLTALDQRKQALAQASKISVQGMQPKLSAVLSLKEESFLLKDHNAKYILKPQTLDWSQLPENEDITMRLAETVGIKVPFHGLLFCIDGSWTYFIKRFDRAGHKDKLPVEDFAQLAGRSRDTKYDFSIEKLIDVINQFMSFPALEKTDFFKRFLFNYLVGNEDMHLKNYSVLVRDSVVRFSPAYDLVNSTMVLSNPREETALSLNGKKRNLTTKDLLKYLPQRLELTAQIQDKILHEIWNGMKTWESLIQKSFLSDEKKERYFNLIQKRRQRLSN